LTKYQYLSDKFKQDFFKYKNHIDPNEHFNKGKLMPGGNLNNAFTPSLRLVEQEALILERGCWYVHCHRQRAYAWLRIDELHDIHYVLF
jgi:hypothetical protein